MLKTNSSPDQHFHTIKAQMRASRRADLMVSYIRQSGVRALREEVTHLCESGGMRLICSFDMGITDPEAVRKLRDLGVEIKIFQMSRGTFHPKVWLFEGNDEHWRCLIGSANFTASAMSSNVEASVLLQNGDVAQQARTLFDELWNSEECCTADDDLLTQWTQRKRDRKNIASQVARATETRNDAKGVQAMEQFVSDWIHIGVQKITKGAGQVIGRQWRGWYIIPDHGEIDDELMDRLSRICQIIDQQPDGRLDISRQGGDPLDKVLEITQAKLKRSKRKMTPRDLFVRQEKNYLVHLGLAFAPTKDELVLTQHGKEATQGGDSLKIAYTEAMEEYIYNGLNLLKFTRNLLAQTQQLDFIEFSFFTAHAWTMEEISVISSLIHTYRRMPQKHQQNFVAKMNDLFDEKLEPTAKSVKTNYDKSVRHTMSALGWCEDLRHDRNQKTIYLENDE